MIDVIIPAYNAHNTIIKTLTSLELQTIKDKINIYIIDDNSLNNYDKEISYFDDLNIKVIKLKDNKGPGYARQCGIENSNNKYIYFLDSDDMLINMFSLETLLNNIGDNDIISGQVVIEGKDNNVDSVKNTEYDLHGKLFKRNYIEKNNYRFNNSYRSEDNSYYRLLRIGTEKFIKIDCEIELYTYNNKSITNSDNNYYINESKYLLENIKWLEIEANKRKFDKKKIGDSILHFLGYFTLLYVESMNKDNFDIIKQRYEDYLNIIKDYTLDIDFESLY